MNKTQKQLRNNLLTAIQVACDLVPEVRVYLGYDRDTDMYAKRITFYSSDRAVTTFQKTLELINSEYTEIEGINYLYQYSICEITLKR